MNTAAQHQQKKHSYRLYIELAALAATIAVCIQQWSLISSAIQEVRGGNIRLLVHVSVLYWTIVPLTAVSYLLLSPIKLSLGRLILAVVAGSGPGRLVPGGFGLLSIAALHMRKHHIPTRLAILIAAANNLIGISLGFIVLIITSFIEPQPIRRLGDQFSVMPLLVLLAAIILAVGTYLIVRRSRAKERTERAAEKSALNDLITHLSGSFVTVIWLWCIAGIILFSNIFILALVARATQTPISFAESVVTLSAGVLIGSIIPTPGGVGGVEIGIASALVFLGYSPKEATTIALAYRFVTFFQPLLPGLISYIYLRRAKEI